MNVFNNVILARNRQLPDDDRMIKTCRSIFKSFNVNNLSVCIGWCADQVTLRSARWNDKKTVHVSDSSSVHHQEFFFTVHTAMVYVIQVC